MKPKEPVEYLSLDEQMTLVKERMLTLPPEQYFSFILNVYHEILLVDERLREHNRRRNRLEAPRLADLKVINGGRLRG